ncbi:hypothetical protein BDB00DRAFT_812563 [Zychaea mexicana]|uniref:uncharacterized protein n=1 Tax=Zychaea mexicana TaxID=64656 RepID=UPI0022FF23AB|nr:uncharacterized protein BDB00DRAFT_812563 [Zychaea mexicana]KAI9495591.1 hypothetical protein BDB00DRAFT_812563 [Zychaea mexicana]
MRYTFTFLAGSLCLINKSLFLTLVNGTINLFKGAYAYQCTYYLYIPFLYCVFFDVCRTAIISSASLQQQPQNANSATTTTDDKINTVPTSGRRFHLRKLLPTYFAYFFTIIYVIITAVWGGMWAHDLNTFAALENLEYFLLFGIWAYVLCAIIQLWVGYRQLQPMIRSLSVYLVGVLVPTIVLTVIALVRGFTPQPSALAADIAQLCLVEILGGLNLLYACLWCSTRYWTFGSRHDNTLIRQQQQPMAHHYNNA